MGHYVYKYVLNNEIIYIGKNDTDLASRLFQHGKPGDNIPESGWDEINKADIYYAELANSIMSDVVESELICKYKPKYNKAKKSDWSGLNFIEPIWYLYNRNNEEIERLKAQNSEYKKRIIELNNLLNNIKTDKALIYSELLSHFRDWEFYTNNLAEYGEKDYLTLEEILNEYKTTNHPLAYISEAFNNKQQLICKKIIYTDSYDMLNFIFCQCGAKSVSGCIYNNRCPKTRMGYYDVLRRWENRGNNMWYPYIKTETDD